MDGDNHWPGSVAKALSGAVTGSAVGALASGAGGIILVAVLEAADDTFTGLSTLSPILALGAGALGVPGGVVAGVLCAVGRGRVRGLLAGIGTGLPLALYLSVRAWLCNEPETQLLEFPFFIGS